MRTTRAALHGMLCVVVVLLIPLYPSVRADATPTISIPGVASYTVHRFVPTALLQEALETHRIAIDTGAGVRVLELRPTIIVDPSAHVYDASGKIVDEDLSTMHTFSGTVVGAPGSTVAVTFSTDWFHMMINSGASVTEIEPLRQWDPAADTWTYMAYESADVRMTGALNNDTSDSWAGASLEAAYAVAPTSNSNASVQPDFGASTVSQLGQLFQSVSTPPLPLGGGQSNKSRGSGNDASYRLADLAATADPQFQTAYPDWTGSIASTVNDVNSILNVYRISLRIIEFRVWSGDADVTNPAQLRKDYRAFINSVTSGFQIAHLFTGKNLDGATLGISYIRGVGTSAGASYAVALTQHVADTGYNPSAFQREILVAHEIGHNFNGVHEQAVQIDGKWTIMVADWQGSNFNAFYSDGRTGAAKNNAQRIIRWTWANLPKMLVIASGLPDTSADGLQLQSFNFVAADPFAVNANIQTQFMLYNTNNFDMTFPSPGIFTGARDSSGNNKDFGYWRGTIYAHSAAVFWSQRALDTSGLWSFWPAYYYNGHYGPYMWHYQTDSVYFVQARVAVPTLSYSPPRIPIIVTAPRAGDGLAFYFYLLTFTSAPRIGYPIYAYSTMFWTGTASPSINYYFVAAIDSNYDNKDFGWTASFYPAPRMYIDYNDVDGQGRGQPGGGTMIYYGSRTLDRTGTWQFWTAFLYNYNFYNFPDTVYLTVSA